MRQPQEPQETRKTRQKGTQCNRPTTSNQKAKKTKTEYHQKDTNDPPQQTRNRTKTINQKPIHILPH